MKAFKRFTAMAVASVMLLGCASFASAEDTAKYTTETTKDGWIKVTQEGGETLGYSPDSGVTLIEQDGFAFKDLNKNGALDVYEDWRLTDEERAADLASKLDMDTIAYLMTMTGTFNVAADGSDAVLMDNGDNQYSMMEAIKGGLRLLLTYVSNNSAKVQATWSNNVQALTEKSDIYGIPFLIATDGRTSYTAGMNRVAISATFNPDFAAQVATMAKEKYQAVGISYLLDPQVDVASEPRWYRINGTFGEDPALSRDLANAYISAFQSTYDENGNDLGWGDDSVANTMKHWPSDAPGEGGREAHRDVGKFNVYPGNAFTTGVIPFVDGAMNLDSKTGSAAAAMTNYSIAYTDDESLGELVGGAYSEYKVQLLRSYGFDGLIITDGSVTSVNQRATDWGVKGLTMSEKDYKALTAGVDLLLGSQNYGEKDCIIDAYQMIVNDIGEQAARERFENSARRVLLIEFRTGMFENAYVDSADALAIVDNNTEAEEIGLSMATSSVVMLKNSANTLNAGSNEKKTVYIPMLYTPASATWAMPINEKIASKYFNIVTDTVGNPTGAVDANGKATYTENDITRATKDEIAECAYTLVFVNSPSLGGMGAGYDSATGEYVPIPLQYNTYTANSEGVRETSIAGDVVESQSETPYGTVTEYVQENRSYYGNSNTVANAYELEYVLQASDSTPEDGKLVVCVNAASSFVCSEFESKADAILIGFGVNYECFCKIVSGQVEPSGLLPLQMPANMETVEAQYEDVPRDMECYVDANGNTYDFAFGLNWSGVINDERVQKYSVPALTEPATQPAK